jgi:hypothetical protein
MTIRNITVSTIIKIVRNLTRRTVIIFFKIRAVQLEIAEGYVILEFLAANVLASPLGYNSMNVVC